MSILEISLGTSLLTVTRDSIENSIIFVPKIIGGHLLGYGRLLEEIRYTGFILLAFKLKLKIYQ